LYFRFGIVDIAKPDDLALFSIQNMEKQDIVAEGGGSEWQVCKIGLFSAIFNQLSIQDKYPSKIWQQSEAVFRIPGADSDPSFHFDRIRLFTLMRIRMRIKVMPTIDHLSTHPPRLHF
jgi:hypothetical protein